MRCALVHDWLTGMRGGEKALEVLCEIFPDADIYTLIHIPGRVSPAIERHRIVVSWLDKLPGAHGNYRALLPLMPAAAGSLRLKGYDLVVAVSHCVAHGARVEGGRFVCYCCTPMRYVWTNLDDYFAGTSHGGAYWLLRAMRSRLKKWDRAAAQRVGEYLAASDNVRDRIRNCYGREAEVVHPPVDTDYFIPGANNRPGEFYLWVGALAPYKRADLALDAFKRLNRRLLVIGEGQDAARLRRMAGSNVEFLGRQPDNALLRCYRDCRALIFPGNEDFGIVPVEAQACGRPVIAYGKGGALESVVDLAGQGEPTGVLFREQTVDSLVEAVQRFERAESHFNPQVLRRNALRFSRRNCLDEFRRRLLTDCSHNQNGMGAPR